MANHRESLEEVERLYGEPIEAIVVGQHDNDPDKWTNNKPTPADENVILSREAGLAKLDQDYDAGYGGADCFPFYAWTKSRVFFVAEYDGATGINYAPRNPVALKPGFSGESPSMDEIEKIVAARKTA